MVTLQQIAEEVGVTRFTVSNVLKGRTEKVSPARADEIRRIAAQLEYRPNGAAKATATGKFGSIALLFSTVASRSTMPRAMRDGILNELERHNLSLSVAHLSDEKLTDAGVVPKILREWMCDGLLVDYTDHIPERMKQLIWAHKLPVVWLNTQQPHDCVYPDDLDAAQRAMQMILEAGHRRVAYLNFCYNPEGEGVHYSAAERKAGYDDAMLQAGLQPRHDMVACDLPERVERAKAMLDSSEPPTCFLTYGKEDAEAVAVAALMRDLQVGSDVSIVAFGPSQSWCAAGQISLMAVPEYEVGQTAVKMLKEKMAQPMNSLPPQKLKFDFEAGTTFAPPRNLRS